MNNHPSKQLTQRLFDLSNQVVVLTGGAGLYGRGLTHSIAATGTTLVLASRDIDALRKIADVENAGGGNVSAEPLDLSEPKTIHNLLERVAAKFGRIDGLVNNAVNRPMRTLSDPLSAWEESMKINATGLFEVTRVFAHYMSEHEGGSIVNIGSIQGMVGVEPGLYEGTTMSTTPSPDYFFHKGGMLNLTRYFASVYGQRGVRVNTLSPGGFYNEQPEPFIKRYTAKTMLGRMADESDLGGPVIFLLSEASKYITGANIPVDGGYTAK